MKGSRRLFAAAAAVAASIVVLAAVGGSANAAGATLTVATAGSGAGTVTGPGIECPGDCSQVYASGRSVTLRANAAARSKFTGWAGACTDGGRCSLTMDADKSVTASFERQRRLSVSTAGSGSGRVRGPGINCPGDCSQLYADGATVTLHRKASAGSRFAGWSRACTGTGPCTLTMDSDKRVRATFRVQRTLSVSIAGSGSGRVRGQRIDCPGNCSALYANGTRVKLRANASGGSAFAGWGGACSGTGSCAVKMNADKSVTATFTARRTLAVSTTGPGSGHVTGPGIDCPDDCSQVYARGRTVTLAHPHGSRFKFAGWSGACSGRGSCSLTMSSNRSVSAKFKFKRPDTEITRARVKPKKRTAKFEFEATGRGKASGFQCQLKRKHHGAKDFNKCQSPKRYRHLKPGKYTFKVRAKGPGGHDQTPAKKKFKIRR